MSQSSKASVIEVIANLALGFVTSFFLNLWIFPLIGHKVSLAENFWITLIFTVVSFFRSLAIRRFFNTLGVKGLMK